MNTGSFEIEGMGEQQTGWVWEACKTFGYLCPVNTWKFRSGASERYWGWRYLFKRRQVVSTS